MSRQEESEDNIKAKIDHLCAELNVDSTAANKAKESFLEIKRNYTLDGDIQHWIACGLYVMCCTSPSTQQSNAKADNCISLTRLLRLCKISLLQFFRKIKLWMEMASMSTDFKEKMETLEHKFAVSDRLFRKFRPLFQEIFNGTPTNDEIDLFKFTWCLYICVKGEFQNANDLVDMYHLLLSCLDHIFANAFMAKRTDLINPNFKGLPSNWGSDNFQVPNKPPCIISIFHQMSYEQKLMVEAAAMKEYSYKPVIKSFFDKGILKGRADQLLGLFDGGNFEANFNSLNNLYETYVLSVGEFDERIFLNEYASERPGGQPNDEISAVIQNFGPSGRTCPETPLSGQRYLPSRGEELTPVSEAARSIQWLTSYLQHCHPQPSSDLLRLFAECNVSEDTINKNVIEPCLGWAELFRARMRELTYSAETINHRCNMVTRFYYKIFEHIIRTEHRKKPQVSLQALLTQETYQLTVYACCTEVVIHAFSIHSLRFPEVLKIYNLSAFHFYKIIELVVQIIFEKSDRDIIKHLNTIEEVVLESEVWKSGSPLWNALERANVPVSADVQNHTEPLANGIQSRAALVEHTRRQLFQDNIRPGQSLLVNAASPSAEPASSPGSTPPRRPHNSLVLFFRKFYGLAVLRMNDLCGRLRLTNEDLKLKIWNCLEHSITHHTSLLKDRHLDQILLCAVYVICRVCNNASNPVERSFADIMRCYRLRPLADNLVYRYVLIEPATEDKPARRNDLITFYNEVYVPLMQNYVLRFNGRHRDFQDGPLSPLPARRGDVSFSPAGRRVSEQHQLYVRPFTAPRVADYQLTYCFSRSPAKDLHAINSLVSCEAATRAAGARRGCEAGVAGDVLKRPRFSAPNVARKLQGVVNDRHAV